MEILLPKSNTGGDESKDQTEWEAIGHSSSATQKEQIKLFGDYLSKLSAKTKYLDEKVQEIESLKKDIEKIKGEANDSLNITRDTRGLAFFGFFALLLVVIGIAYGYWEFISTSSKNDDYRFSLSERLNNNENQIKLLKECLDISKWLNPKCLEN